MLTLLPFSMRAELRFEAFATDLKQHPFFFLYGFAEPGALLQICDSAMDEVSLLAQAELFSTLKAPPAASGGAAPAARAAPRERRPTGTREARRPAPAAARSPARQRLCSAPQRQSLRLALPQRLPLRASRSPLCRVPKQADIGARPRCVVNAPAPQAPPRRALNPHDFPRARAERGCERAHIALSLGHIRDTLRSTPRRLCLLHRTLDARLAPHLLCAIPSCSAVHPPRERLVHRSGATPRASRRLLGLLEGLPSRANPSPFGRVPKQASIGARLR